MRKEIHGAAKHRLVPVEDQFGIDRENLMAVGFRRGRGGSYATVALEEVFGVREITIRTWLCRSRMQGQKLHERFMVELGLVHVQLDEAFGCAKRRANVKEGGQEMWVWIASDAKTKLISVMGGRSQAMAFAVVYELKGRLAAGCVPVFSTDGLKHYYYALTAHFGKWETAEGKKPVWVLVNDFVYSQVIVFASQPYHQRRRRTVAVERRILVGDMPQYGARLRKAGLSGRINTAFVERLNLSIRHCVSKLTRRTWGPAKYTPELMEHLEWWRHRNGELITILSDRTRAWQRHWRSL